MCGFVALLSPKMNECVDMLKRSIESISHRGPDHTNIWTCSSNIFSVGFNRLSQVGSFNHTQPIVCENSQLVLVAIGEIYGYKKIREALQKSGAEFKTDTDSEVILHAYQKIGLDFIKHLNGEFAFLIWDKQTHKLIAARDRWGVKPLFFSKTPWGFAFASEIKALLKLGVNAKWNKCSLFQHIFASMGPSETLFDGVSQLEPGHIMHGSLREEFYTRSYWNLNDDFNHQFNFNKKDTSPHVITKNITSNFRDAVNLRLHGNSPVACYLSGGLDSTAITSMASKLTKNKIDAYTVSFPGNDDEVKIARKTAETLGVNHHTLCLSDEDFSQNFSSMIYHAEIFGFNSVGVAKYLLGKRLKRDGYRAVLVGDGADELFAGYEFSIMDSILSQGSNKTILDSYIFGGSNNEKLFKKIGFLKNKFSLDFLGKRVERIPSLFIQWNNSRSYLKNFLSDDFLLLFKGYNPFEMLLNNIHDLNIDQCHGLRPSLNIWLKSLFINHILVSERLEMASGVEARYPFLDNKISKLSLSIDDNLLISKGIEKYILKESFKNMIPNNVYQRCKKPFSTSTMMNTKNNKFYDYTMEVLTDSSCKRISFINHNFLSKFINYLNNNRDDSNSAIENMLIVLLSIVVFHQVFTMSE